jgi:hypothetical protein
MSIKRRLDQIVLHAGFAAQIPPLGDADRAFLARVMHEIAPDWSVELEGIASGDATLVVIPDDGDDATGPTFIVTRETYGLRVNQLHWDALTEVGVFASLSDVVAALQARLAFCLDIAVPPSVTLH